jgi:hypothetical protein
MISGAKKIVSGESEITFLAFERAFYPAIIEFCGLIAANYKKQKR